MGTQMTQITQIYANFLKNCPKGKSAFICVSCVICVLPFLLALSTVFVIDRHLANGVVSGKYFWFYGSSGLMTAVGALRATPLRRLKGVPNNYFIIHKKR
jgi:hypothetical protein